MDREILQEMLKELLDDSFDRHLGSVHEEISDLRSEVDGLREEMTNEFSGVRKEIRDGFAGVKSDIGGVHNRIDNEIFARKDLEQRMRKVVPKLPEASSVQ